MAWMGTATTNVPRIIPLALITVGIRSVLLVNKLCGNVLRTAKVQIHPHRSEINFSRKYMTM